MPTRTNRLIGKAWGNSANPASITVEYNGAQVFSGTVPTANTPRTHDEINTNTDILCTWETDSSVAGENIPVKITVNGCGSDGVVNIWSITMNHIQAAVTKALRTEAVWPGYKPASIEEFEADVASPENGGLTDEEFFAKYSAPKDGLHPDSIKYVNREYTITVPIENNFIQPGPGKILDSKHNIKINGEAVEIVREPGENGTWPIDAVDGTIVEFDLHVSPPRLNPTYQS